MVTRFAVNLVLLLCAMTIDANAADSVVVGKFDGMAIHATEVNNFLQALTPQARAQIASSQDNLERVVRSELLRKKLIADARAKGVDQLPPVRTAMSQAGDRVLLDYYLNSLARPVSGYPDDDEIRNFYYANEGLFLVAKRFHIAQIFLSSPDDAAPAAAAAARKKADSLVAQIKSGKDFAEVAKANSDDKAAKDRGGDVGWLFATQLLPDIQTALNALAKDEVSAPVRTHAGWHILKLLDVQPSAMQPLSAARDAIIAQLRQRKIRENQVSYEAEMMRKSPPEINHDALENLRNSIH